MYVRTSRRSKSAKKLGFANRKFKNNKSANHKRRLGSEIREVPHMRKVRKSKKLFKSANLQISDLQKLFADHPPLAN
jgi:hypothetical protein